MKNILFGFLNVLLLLSCNDNKAAPEIVSAKPKPAQTILGSWRLVDVTSNKKIETPNEDKLLRVAKEKEIIRQGLVVSFFKDGRYTQLQGNSLYETGSWRYQKSNRALYLTSGGHTDSFLVILEFVQNKNAVILKSSNERPSLKLMQSAISLQDYKEDPFYPENNLWRTKPPLKENTLAIQERLANYFKHLTYILKASKERKASIVSFEFSQGIVKIYNGGIGITPQTEVPNYWKETYHSADDALIAYNMFRTYLQSAPPYKGAGTGDWIEDDYNILVGMYGDIKQGRYTTSKTN